MDNTPCAGDTQAERQQNAAAAGGAGAANAVAVVPLRVAASL